jgi:tRNA-specific 2-thiouridylase
VLGTHDGQHLFTVGQRRGVGLAAGSPLYVLEKDAERNRVVVGPREELATRRVALRGVRLRRDAARVDRVKLRYRSRPVAARLPDQAPPGRPGHAVIELLAPVEGAAPGQLACLMDGDLVVGWGTIARDPQRP